MNILIVEDDHFLAQKIKESFEKQVITNQIHIVSSYTHFLSKLPLLESYDILLTDIQLSNNVDQSGVEIIQLIRQKQINIPIVVISSFSDLHRLEKMFNLGANDYLIKPFRIGELQIRVLKWFKIHFRSLDLTNKNKVSYYDLVYDLDVNEFYFRDQKISLSKKSKYILSLFLSHPEVLLRESMLIEKIWLDRDNSIQRNLRVIILRLKKSLQNFGVDCWIENVRGEGYIFIKK